MARIKAARRRKPRAQEPPDGARASRAAAIRAAVSDYTLTARKVTQILIEHGINANELYRALRASGKDLRGIRPPTSAEIDQLYSEGWSTARLRERFGLSKPKVNALLGIRTESEEGVWA